MNIDAEELELMGTKFWDYRLVAPEIATTIFIRDYVKVVSLYNERHGVSRHTDILKGFELHQPTMWRNWNMLEKARKLCDRHGISYQRFWAFAVEEHERLGWKPRYVNVFCGPKLTQKVIKRHEEYVCKFIITSNHPFFMANGYVGCKLQKAYYRNILLQIFYKYGSKSKEIVKTMIKDGIVSEGFISDGK